MAEASLIRGRRHLLQDLGYRHRGSLYRASIWPWFSGSGDKCPLPTLRAYRRVRRDPSPATKRLNQIAHYLRFGHSLREPRSALIRLKA